MMMASLKTAAREGLLLGVKYGVVLLVLGFLILWALGDYAITRARATNGQMAFEAIQRAQQQRAAAPKPAPETGPPNAALTEKKPR